MKTKIKLLTLSFLMFTSVSAFSACYVIGLAPTYNEPDRDTVFKSVLQFVLEGASAGDEILVCDAVNLRVTAKLSIPDNPALQKNPRVRAQQLKSEIVAFRQFLMAQTSGMNGVIHAPEFLFFAGSQLKQREQEIAVILLGSAIYLNSAEPAFNMTDAFPSDAHLFADAAESPFSTVNHEQILSGVTVHYAYLRNCFTNQLHQERLERFYSLFISHCSGILVTFAADPALAFERARQNIKQPCLVAQLDRSDAKLEMRRAVARSLPAWFPPTNTIHVLAALTNAVAPSAQVAQFPVANRSSEGIIGIGIMWAAKGCDFDLWVSPKTGARDLYFGNQQSQDGRYFHDYRDRNDQQDFEYVELKGSTDIRHIKAWVNFYAGHAASPIGIAVVHYQGKTYQAAFSIESKGGNQARDLQGRSKSPYWTEINLERMVGISP